MLESMKFHHIGVAVKDISATAAVYIVGGYKQSGIIYDPKQNVNICWLTKEDMPVVELIEPADETSPINKILEKNGRNRQTLWGEYSDANPKTVAKRYMIEKS